jgi:hypothetical protein
MATTSKRSTGKPAAKKKQAPQVDVAAIENNLMAAVRKQVPGSTWTKKAFYQRLNVKGEARSIVQLWRQARQLRLEFSNGNGHGGLDIVRLGSVAEVPKGVKAIERRVAERRALTAKHGPAPARGPRRTS